MTKSRLLVSSAVAMLALFGAGAALAAPAAGSDAPSGQATAPVKDPSAAQAVAVEEVVVTAQKREENLQSVPVSVSAFTQETFARNQIVGVQDLNNAVPSLIVQANPNSSNSAQIFLRGIGQDNSTILDEVAVGVYVDGVYMGRNVGSLMDLNNVERIEVLRGPQGTLYGRNSTGGAIKLESHRPTFDALGFNGDLTVGSFNRIDVRGAVNIPLSDNLAANLSFLSLTNDGFYHNSLTGQKLNTKNTQSVRGTVLWNATDKLSVYLSADYSLDRSSIQVGTQMSGLTPPLDNVPLYGDIFEARPNVPDLNHFDGWGAAMTIDYDAGFGKFESITAWRGFGYDVNLDLGGSDVGLDILRSTHQHQVSQELQFTSSFSDRLSTTMGLYFFRESANEELGLAIAPGFVLPFGSHQVSQSYAAYGQAEYKVTDWLTGIVGGRWTHDQKDLERSGIFQGVTASQSWSNFTPKVGLSAQVNPNTLVFATYSEGYKAGVYQPFPSDLLTASAALEPEKVKAIEVGIKSDWWDRRVRANISAFDNKYRDLQLSLLSDNGAVQSLSADLTVKGIEAELTLVPMEGLRIFGSGSLMDSHFTAVPPPGAGTPAPDDEQKFTPRFSGRIGAEYSWNPVPGHELTVGANYEWTDHYFHGYPNALTYKGGYGMLDARIAYTHGDGDWGLELAGKNLTNTTYWNYTSYLAGLTRFYQPGRTWMMRLKVRM